MAVMDNWSAMAAARRHMANEYPLEGCGAIVGGSYMPLENWHPEPRVDFFIRYKDQARIFSEGLEAIVHSHIGNNVFSQEDRHRQKIHAVPWILFHVDYRGVRGVAVLGADR